MRDATATAALAFALLPLAVALCARLPRATHACAQPRTAVAARACVRGAGALHGAQRLLFGGRLDPNRAGRQELMLLPGIGPARAAAIAAERTQRAFRSVEELDRVPGIGPRTLEKLRPWLQIEPGVADR